MRRLPALLFGVVCAGAALAVLALALRTPYPVPGNGPTQAQTDALSAKYGLEPPVERPETASRDWGWSVRP